MALGGLKKDDRKDKEKVQIDDFISGAKKRVEELKPKRTRNYERYMFSLTPEVSAAIDRMAFLPTTFRASRSDVVKAALALLEEQEEFLISSYIAKAAKS